MFQSIAKSIYRAALQMMVTVFGRERLFTAYFRLNFWRDPESASGQGSNLASAEHLIKELPDLMAELDCGSMLDAPCGDYNWGRHMKFAGKYIGVDIVRPLIERNEQTFGSPVRRFMHADIQSDPLPVVDLILCRDGLVHFSYSDVWKSIANFKRSGSTYLLTTTFPGFRNRDISTGDWRGLNLEEAPFHFPPPIKRIQEHADPPFECKQLALWRIADLPHQ